MASKTVWAKYWPAALFAVSNVAALTLVIKANSAVDAPADDSSYPATATAEPWGTPGTDDPFDPVNSSANIDGKSPLLWDFGSDFDLDQPVGEQRSLGFLDAAKNRLRQLKDKAANSARQGQRQARERELLSQPWNLNYYDPAGNFLGRQSISPPWVGNIPPLPPLDNYSLKTGGHDVSVSTDGNRTMILRVDPQWFKDTSSMALFVSELADKMIVAGIQPQVEVGRTASSSTLGVDAGMPGARPPIAVVLPPDARPVRVATGRIPVSQPLPKPPADIRTGSAPPAFNPQLGERLPPPRRIRAQPAGTVPPMPDGKRHRVPERGGRQRPTSSRSTPPGDEPAETRRPSRGQAGSGLRAPRPSRAEARTEVRLQISSPRSRQTSRLRGCVRLAGLLRGSLGKPPRTGSGWSIPGSSPAGGRQRRFGQDPLHGLRRLVQLSLAPTLESDLRHALDRTRPRAVRPGRRHRGRAHRHGLCLHRGSALAARGSVALQ